MKLGQGGEVVAAALLLLLPLRHPDISCGLFPRLKAE